MRAAAYQLITVYQQIEAVEAAMAVLSRWDGEFSSTLGGLTKKRDHLEARAKEIQDSLKTSRRQVVSSGIHRGH